MRIFYLLLLIILFIINVISCDSEKNTKKSIKVIKSSEISFKDQNDRIITLDKAAKNVVMIPMPGTSILVAIDQSIKRIKGINPSAKKTAMEGILAEFFPKIKSISTNMVTEKFVPNIEELLKINPDLVFQWSFQKNYQKHLEKMENVGLKVVAFKLDAQRDWLPGWIKIIGSSIGLLDKANKLLDWRNKLKENFKQSILKIKDKDRLRVLCLLNYKNSYRTWNLTHSRHMQLLQVNFPSQKEGEKLDFRPKIVNAEYILKWNPEILFLSTIERGLSPQDIYNDKLFSEVNAVKNKRVYKIPLGGYRWDVPSHEIPLSWMWMSMILYPDYFNFDLRKEIKTWYKIMYGKIPSKKQIDNILRINMNKNSKNYERFL